MPLSEAQKKYLRGRGHQLKPVIMIGDAGLSESLLDEYVSTLAHHELIKVRVNVGDRSAHGSMIEELCRHGAAELVHQIGNMALLYRENPDRKKIRLPNT